MVDEKGTFERMVNDSMRGRTLAIEGKQYQFQKFRT